MEVKKRKVYEEKEVSVYVSFDGKEFEQPTDCECYEEEVTNKLLDESPDIIVCGEAEDYMPFDGAEYYENHTYKWLKPLNEKGVELLNKVFGDVIDKEYIGEWTCFEISDDDVYVTRLSHGIDYVTNILSLLDVEYPKPEVVEVCPNCRREAAMRWDVKEDGYKAYCPYCGKRLMLCDECRHKQESGEEAANDCDYDSKSDTCRFQDGEFEYLINYAKSSENGRDDLKTLRTLWTAYCYHKNIDVDTSAYDSKISELWDALRGNSSEDSGAGFDKFERYMCKHLV